MQLDESEDMDGEEIEYTAPGEPSLLALTDPYQANRTPAENENQHDARSEEIFEELLDRVEEEAAETEALAGLAPPEFIAELTAAENSEVAGEMAPAAGQSANGGAAEAAPSAESQPFTDTEWQLLTNVVGRFERPASFQQIHDQLRDARNNAGISRTNEELRSLVKQAINTGLLERIGKGNRASYQLAQPAEAADDAPDQATLIAEIVAGEPEFHTPEAAAQAELANVAAPTPSTPSQPAPAKRTRARRKPAQASAATPVAEAAPAKPARASRKKAAPAPEAAAPAPAEAPAKPKRARRKKSESS
jgi:hypothetical protein